jgi:hypothetical protein
VGPALPASLAISHEESLKMAVSLQSQDHLDLLQAEKQGVVITIFKADALGSYTSMWTTEQ